MIEHLYEKYVIGKRFSFISNFFSFGDFAKSKYRLIDIYYVDTHVSFAQIYPYIYYRKQIKARYGASIRLFPVEGLLKLANAPVSAAEIVLFQTPHGMQQHKILEVATKLQQAGCSKLIYIDSFAHSDIRLSCVLDSEISFYIKKSLFLDRNLYIKEFLGDTNLTEYYSTRYNIEMSPSNFNVPSSIFCKLRKSPGFFMSPRFISRFYANPRNFSKTRDINIHARFGADRTHEWYNAMRLDLLERVCALDCPGTLVGAGVGRRQYMAELRRSKICISPFGYGELCWRDVEAFQTGAALVKPDMSHLETLPELFVPYETYVPIRWDFSDLKEAIDLILGDDELRDRLAFNAYRRIHDYIKEERFVDDISFMFR